MAQELGDVAEAVNSLDDSYQFAGHVYIGGGCACPLNGVSRETITPSTTYVDAADSNNVQAVASEPDGLNLDGSLRVFVNGGEDGI